MTLLPARACLCSRQIRQKTAAKIEADQIALGANLIKIKAALGSVASTSLAQTAFESTIEETS
jgi:hypothetical protein